MRKLVVSFISFLATLLLLSGGNAFAMQAGTSSNLRGIDVSHWDGVINWSQVKSSGIQFAYIKATGGTSFVDPQFAYNVQNAEANGIAVGAYHYAQPARPFKPNDAVQQATFFVNTMKSVMPKYGDIMPVLDLETSNNLSVSDLVQWTNLFIQTVEQQTGRKVMLYTDEGFIQQENDFNNALSNVPLWVGWYGYLNNNTVPPNIAGWSSWTTWQYTDQGVVNGITGNVDLDYGATSLDDMQGYLTQTVTTSTTTRTTSKTTASTPTVTTKSHKRSV